MKRREPEPDTEEEIGKDIRKILKGENVRNSPNRQREDGPGIPPGMEDRGIGSVNGEPVRKRTEKEIRKARRKRNSTYFFISYAFVAIFLILIGHLIYFNLYLKDDILNSPYNKRQDSASEYVIRGNITTEDGAVLAKTDVGADGTETRTYPGGREYCHVVGFTTHGKSGLESKANYQLLTAHNNVFDQVINAFEKKKNPGDTVVTTLNTGIQDAAYHAIGQYQGAVIALDPATGEIRAMVSQPTFDPNTLASEWDSIVSESSNSQLLNRATQGLYAPGSTFKMVTALAYYDKYNTIDNFSYNCTGEFPVGNIVVHCFGGAVHGQLDLTGAFAHSCNTSFSQIGLDVGSRALTEAAKKMLFAEDLPSDITATKSRWSLKSSSADAELVQTAFGQGQTLVTPYHMALMVSAIANNGVLMTPHLIKEVENNAGTAVSETKVETNRKVLSATEATVLQNLMRSVVTDGTGRALADKNYKAFGKTGSADYIRTDGSTGTHAWFAGYATKEDRSLVVVVLAEDGGAGSTTAVPMASKVFDAYFGE